MAYFVNERKAVNDNVFEYESRLKSPVARFLDTTPSFTTYYHLNPDHITTDEGFQDVSSLIGFRSPLRYNKIVQFPLYGLEQMMLQIQDTDFGLDSTYEGEAVVMSSTIKPLPNDFFTISTIKFPCVFRVTEILYDTVMPNNYYKINFSLQWIDEEMLSQLEAQVIENYTCIFENIGTEMNSLIKTEDYSRIEDIKKMYDDICGVYKSLYYNDRHNCFLGEFGAGISVYDPYQTRFINTHRLFNKKNDYMTLILTDQLTDSHRDIKYERSIYRFVERRKPNFVKPFKFSIFQGLTRPETTFARWYDKYIYILDTVGEGISCVNQILSDKFVLAVRMNGPTDSSYAEFLKRFLRNEKLTLADIPTNLNDELLDLEGNMEVFFITPILLYAIKVTLEECLHIEF